MVDISQVPLIPRQVLFGNPDKAMARLSPNGQQLAYLAPVNGVLNVWVGPSGKPDEMKPVTDDTGRGIRFYAWAYTNEHILYIQDKGGDENWHLYSVNLSTGEIKNLTPFEGVQAQVQAASMETPNEVIVGLNERNPQLHDLYRINITSGERQLIQQNDGFMGFILDEDYRVRYANRMRPDGGFEMLKVTDDGQWPMFMEVPGEDQLTTNVIGFDRMGDTLYMTASKDRDTAALYAIDPETGELTMLAEDARADAGDVMIHPTQKRIQAVAFNYERKEWRLLDQAIEKDIAFLKTVAGGEVEIVSRTLDDQTWLAAYLMDDGPVRYYRYDRQEKAAEFLFTDRQALENQPLAKMRSAVIRSRDGLDLVSYYTLPVGSDSVGNGRPDQPLPMVLFVHGGPWARDQWGYNSFHQFFANRGYAVLAVNFRGSTGFGKAFVNAGNFEWAAAMHDDLLDGVAWAIEQGIADPDRVAIAGGSYGGYATLVGMTFTPETFACGVDIVGPSNVITLLESIPPYWAPMLELFTTRVGDFRTEEGRALLRERSPLTYVDNIKRPLLIGQGANDPRVKQAEADQIVEAMQEKGIPVTYVLYSDEGHGFARPENNMSFTAVAEAFIAPILGGRFEPIGSDFEGSSISVPVGAEEVPGLAGALPGGN
jgi:dipeptidyl aminopeptidase/acylaminoacyl peptidase